MNNQQNPYNQGFQLGQPMMPPPPIFPNRAITETMKVFYTKDEIDEILKLYLLSKEEFNAVIQNYATRTYVDEEIEST